MPPPKVEFDWSKLNAILEYGCSGADACEIMGVCYNTIADRIKLTHNATFQEYRIKKMAKKRYKLREKQYELAMAGNVAMLIWLGKNELGQKDRQEMDIGNKENKVFKLAYSMND